MKIVIEVQLTEEQRYQLHQHAHEEFVAGREESFEEVDYLKSWVTRVLAEAVTHSFEVKAELKLDDRAAAEARAAKAIANAKKKGVDFNDRLDTYSDADLEYFLNNYGDWADKE